jgi:hypothetical protein
MRSIRGHVSRALITASLLGGLTACGGEHPAAPAKPVHTFKNPAAAGAQPPLVRHLHPPPGTG